MAEYRYTMNDNERHRRLMAFRLPQRELIKVFNGRLAITSTWLPRDARVERMHFDPLNDGFILIVSSEHYEIVDDGSPIPEATRLLFLNSFLDPTPLPPDGSPRA